MIDIANEQGRFNGDIVLVKNRSSSEAWIVSTSRNVSITVQLRGIVDGEPKRINRIVTSVADAVDAYGEYEKYAAFANWIHSVISYLIQQRQGIVYDDTDRLRDKPAEELSGKINQVLI